MAQSSPGSHSVTAEAPASSRELLERLSSKRFSQWYRKREWRKNIEEGHPYFNGPGSVTDPERHNPSQLLQCHRKIVYRQENAPSERPDPRGIFWFGTRFEEDLLFPFLNRVTGSETFVQNSIWIDFTTESHDNQVRIKGATDPVIVDSDATPILPTEIKTKSSVENLTEPSRHHRAQIHAYLVGLSQKFSRDLSDAVLIYGGRDTLDLKTFHIEFDQEFWEDVVVEWSQRHTQYRLDNELPPADPEFDWECRFCSYRTRCGKDDTAHQNHDANGLLTGYAGYPREAVVEYLEDNPEEALTPTLARKFPDLIDVYGVVNWHCEKCGSEVDWDEADPQRSPICPYCAERDRIEELTVVQGVE